MTRRHWNPVVSRHGNDWAVRERVLDGIWVDDWSIGTERVAKDDSFVRDGVWERVKELK